MWCRSRPGAPLDRSCAEYLVRVMRIYGQHTKEWSKIPGVQSVGYGINFRGFFPEVQVWVKDRAAVALVRPKIPTSVDGFTVAVLPPARATSPDASAAVRPLRAAHKRPPSFKCPSTAQKAGRTLKKNWEAWSRIPGVLGAGPRCKAGCCYDQLEVVAQPPLLESVRAKIPREVHGIPVDVIPVRPPPWK